MAIFDSPFRMAPVAFRFDDLYAPRQPQVGQQPDVQLTPEDEQGLLRSAVDVGLSGLAKAGNILDLPGSSVRDILSGENPFDQWLPWNWTSGQNRTSPEDMLQKFGVLTPQFRKQHPIWSFLGGTAAAIATDPLTWTGLPGASRLSQAGKVAERAGLLRNLDAFLEPGMGRAVGGMTRTLGDLVPTSSEISQLRANGLVREADDAAAKLLAAENAATKMGTTVDALRGEVLGSRNMLPESLGMPLAGALDTAGAAIGRTAPVRALRAAFDATAGGFFPEFRQKIASVRHALLPGARRDARYKAIELAEEAKTIVDGFRQAFGTAGFADEDIARFADDVIRFSEEFLGKQKPRGTEYAEGIQMVREAAERRMGLAPGTLGSVGQQLPMEAETLSFAKKIADLNTATRDHLVNMGGKIGWIETYAPRFLDQPAIQSLKLEAMRGGRVMGTVGPSQIGRSPEIADLYTQVVNTMASDPQIRQFTMPAAGAAAKKSPDLAATAAAVRANYGQWLDNQYGAADELKDIAKMPEVTPAEQAAKAAAIAQSEAKSLERHSKTIAKWLHQHKKPQQLFTRETLRDQLDSMMGQFKVNKTAEAIHETFKQFAEDFSGAGVTNPVSWKPTFRNGRWGRRAVTKSWRSDEWMTLDKAFETAGLDKDKALEYFARKFGIQGGADEAAKMAVPANLANATAGMMEASTNTEFQSLIGDAIDTMNRMFKVGVTAHPANWIRNWYSGQFVNIAASGEIAGPADIASYVKHAGQAWNQRQDEKLIREMLLEGVIDPAFGSEGVEFTGALSKDPRLLNQSPFGFRDSLATARTDVAGWTKASEMGEAVAGLPNDALAAKGAALDRRVKQIQTAWQTGVNTSAKANNLVEWNNRVPMYLYLKSKGFSPAEAAEKVRFLQLDYRNGLSQFEKTYMRRIMPFYSFCVPDDCEILTRDGWKFVDDVLVGEEVLSMDHETGTSTWVPCEAVNVFDYDGELMAFKGGYEEFLFTPSHNWPIVAKTTLTEGGVIRKIVPGYKLQQGWSIPRFATFVGTGTVEMTPREAAILGWIVTDGYHRTRASSPNHTEFVIYQSPGKYLEEIVELLGSESCSRGKPHPDSGVVCVRIIGELRARVQSLMRSKEDFLRLVTRMSRECLDSCFDAMLKAEGTRAGSNYGTSRPMNNFGQEGSLVADAFQIICQLRGLVAQKNPTGVNICHHETSLSIRDKNFSTKWYTGRVWCPTTKHGTWLMRRNGRIIWTGNSRLMAPVMLKTLKDKPGGVMAQMIKASSRMGGRDAMTPEYVSEGLSVPLGTTPEGDVRYFSATGMPYEDLFGFFGGRSITRTMGLEAASRLTPYLKGPAEWVTGRSFFQQGPSGGRDITDLDPVLGRTVANATQYLRYLAGDKQALSERPLPAKFPDAIEQIVSNSPLSRYATSTRTLLDPRKNALEKAVNLLSGARVTTISQRAQLAMAQERLGVLGKEQFGLKDMIINYLPEQELEMLQRIDPEKYVQAMKFRALQSAINKQRRALREEAKK